MRIFRLLLGRGLFSLLLNKLDLCAIALWTFTYLCVFPSLRTALRSVPVRYAFRPGQCTVYLLRLLNLKSSASRFCHQPTSLRHTLRFCASNLSCISTLFSVLLICIKPRQNSYCKCAQIHWDPVKTSLSNITGSQQHFSERPSGYEIHLGHLQLDLLLCPI